MPKFDLTNEDRRAVEVAREVAQFLLTLERVTPQQIVGLGNALYALERLPEVTPGVFCEFGVAYRAGTEEFNELRYIEFSIADTAFEISTGGHTYDRAVGGDSYSDLGWRIEIDGIRLGEHPDVVHLADSIREYVNLGAELVVRDESDIEYE